MTETPNEPVGRTGTPETGMAGAGATGTGADGMGAGGRGPDGMDADGMRGAGVDRALERVEQHRSDPDHGTRHHAGYERGDRLFPPDQCDELSLRLREAVGGFVDDPRAAVEEADRVLEEVGTRLSDALSRHRGSLRESWQGPGQRQGTGNGHMAGHAAEPGTDRADAATASATSAHSGATSPDHSGADTERLRRALQNYRELAERLLRA